MAKLTARDEVLKKLGIDPTKKATIAFAMWQPWVSDEEHGNDPQGFVGIYGGYKIAQSKMQGNGGSSVFDLFAFDRCEPAPSDGSTGYAVSSSFMLEELKRVEPGTKIAIVFNGSEKNNHGGMTHIVEWFFADPADRTRRVKSQALPPSNAEKMKQLVSHDEIENNSAPPF